MKKGLRATGIIPFKDLKNSPGFPSPKRQRMGAVCVIECTEEIPCDPCEMACSMGAIRIGKPITNLPRLNDKKCTGCGSCIPVCPGLAIFVVDCTFSCSMALVSIPHEYLPLPKVGSTVYALNRAGDTLCQAKVVKVKNPEKYDRTAVVSVAVPKRFALQVRGIRYAKAN